MAFPPALRYEQVERNPLWSSFLSLLDASELEFNIFHKNSDNQNQTPLLQSKNKIIIKKFKKTDKQSDHKHFEKTRDTLLEKPMIYELQNKFKYSQKWVHPEVGSSHLAQEEEVKNSNKKLKKWPSSSFNMPPTDLNNWIRNMGGTNVVLVIQKALSKTDVSPNHNRLSIPVGQIRAEFLSGEEKRMLNSSSRQGGISEISVVLIEANLDVCSVNLRKWDMTKTFMYVLVKNWNSVVSRNRLCENQIIQLWSFRNKDDNLCFALVKLKNGDGGGERGDSCSKTH